jgi:hypothetical protein
LVLPQPATLTNPSVVNGAQTLYAVSTSGSRASSAEVTTRVIVRGKHADVPVEDDKWLQSVIRGVNTQNRVRPGDFYSNEPEQIELQTRFRDLGVFYERKRGEWREYRNEARFRGFDRVNLDTLSAILSVSADESGDGVLLVKRGSDGLFAEKHYRTMFPSRSTVGRRFPRIYFAYRIYELLNAHGYKDARTYHKQRHAYWNCLWLLHLCLRKACTGCDAQALRGAFDRLDGRTADARRARNAIRKLTDAVWRAWRQARKADPDRWTANNYFKARYGNQKSLRLALPKVRPALRAFSRFLSSSR